MRTTILFALWLAAACSNSGERSKTYPVSGRLTFKDPQKGNVPVDGARIDFVPAGENLTARQRDHAGAITGADGSYTLQTYAPGDGAPPGQYIVLVTWNKGGGDGERATGTDRLNGKYNNRNSPVLKAEVKPQSQNQFDFELNP